MRLLVSLLFCLVASAGPVVVEDNFADGNLSSDPAWRADPTVNWFNCWHVEQTGGRSWATCHRFGSMATPFLDPEHPGWRLTLDLADGPIETTFTVRFEEISPRNSVGIFVLGRSQRISMRLAADGGLHVHLINNADDDREIVHDGGRLPPFPLAESRQVTARYSREAGVQLFIEDQEMYRLDPEKLATAQPLLTTFDSVAFSGTRDAGAPNIELLRSSGLDPAAKVRLTAIRVSGARPTVVAPPQPPLPETADGVLLICGIGLAGALEPAAIDPQWTVVYGRYPRLGDSLAAYLTPTALRDYRWLILADVDGRELGWQVAQTLGEYVRSGGSLLLLGGTVGVVPWLNGPFAEDLPVRVVPAEALLEPITTEPAAYAQPVTGDGGPVYERGVGAGRIRVLGWATVGKPTAPFWADPDWLRTLIAEPKPDTP